MTGGIERIRNKELKSRIASADEAVGIIEDGMTVGVTGTETEIFSEALLKRAQKDKNFGITLWAETVGLEMDRTLGETGIIRKRLGQQTYAQMRNAINAGKAAYFDIGLTKYCRAPRTHEYGSIDIAIAQAIAITKEGDIIPSRTVLDMPNFVEAASKVIVRLNPFYPAEMEGMHDIYLRQGPPYPEPIPLTNLSGRMGTPFIPAGIDKISHIVVADAPDIFPPKPMPTQTGKRIANNLLSFFRQEVSLGRLPSKLLPIEIGMGSIPDMVVEELCRSEFKNLEFSSGILPSGIIDLIDLGKVRVASGSMLILTEENEKQVFNNINKYKEFIILRPVEISDSPELLIRLGFIGLNSVVEMDIYGHGNGTHTLGTNIINGIGGLGEFTENAYISVLMLPSVAKNGDISNIVPMVPHVDVNEHHVDVIVTEQGVADVRGLPPMERAEKIIEHCAHPDYRPLLRDYFNRAVRQVGGHEPHLLDEAFSFHQRFLKTNSMKKP